MSRGRGRPRRDSGAVPGCDSIGRVRDAGEATVLIRARLDNPYDGPPLTFPVFAGVAALLLVLLFGFGRAVGRIRRDLRAEAAGSVPEQP